MGPSFARVITFAMFRGGIMRPMHDGGAFPQYFMLLNRMLVGSVCLVVCSALLIQCGVEASGR